MRGRRHDPDTLRARNPLAPLVLIAPFGQTGPQAEEPATDLTLFYASGIARLLTGQVDDLAEAPIRPTGQQSAFIGGVAAACAGMHAAPRPTAGAVIDVSVQEALATLAMTELTRAGLSDKGWSRKRLTDGNGATVCILPARDGYVAISPREEHQWRSWLAVMGSPGLGRRSAVRPQARPRRQLGRAACADVAVEPCSTTSSGSPTPRRTRMCRASRCANRRTLLDSPQLAHRPLLPRDDGSATAACRRPARRSALTLTPADADRRPCAGRCRCPACACWTSVG